MEVWSGESYFTAGGGVEYKSPHGWDEAHTSLFLMTQAPVTVFSIIFFFFSYTFLHTGSIGTAPPGFVRHQSANH